MIRFVCLIFIRNREFITLNSPLKMIRQLHLSTCSLQLKCPQETAHIKVLGQLFGCGADKDIAHIVSETHQEQQNGIFAKVLFHVFGLADVEEQYQRISFGLEGHNGSIFLRHNDISSLISRIYRFHSHSLD